MTAIDTSYGSQNELRAFRAELIERLGRVVKHKGGSAGVYEFTPNGTPVEMWSYGNAVAYSGAALEVIDLLDEWIGDDSHQHERNANNEVQ